MPDAAPTEALHYSPEDIANHGAENGWDAARTAAALREHRDNLATYIHDNYDAADSWKAVAKVDADTQTQLEAARIKAAQAAITTALPDPEERQQFAAQLEAGGYDPAAIDDQWQSAAQAFAKTANDPAFTLPKRTAAKRFMIGNQLGAIVEEHPQSGGHSDFLIHPAGEQVTKPFTARIPTVTDKDLQTEIEKKQKELDTAAEKWGAVSEKIRKADSGEAPWYQIQGSERFLAERDAAQAAAEKARAELDVLKSQGKQFLTDERLRQTLADPKYRGKIGEYHGFNQAAKGVQDVGLGALALGARAIDSAIDSATGDEAMMQRVKDFADAIETTEPDSSRRQLEGGHWNDFVNTAQRSGTSMLAAMGTRIPTAVFGVQAAGGAEIESQRKIDEAEAAGDHATAARIRFGRDLHALLSGAVMAGFSRISPIERLKVSGPGLKGFAVDALKQGLEMPAMGITQRALVDPIIGEHPDVLAPVVDEAIAGMGLAVPFAGLAHAKGSRDASRLEAAKNNTFNKDYDARVQKARDDWNALLNHANVSAANDAQPGSSASSPARNVRADATATSGEAQGAAGSTPAVGTPSLNNRFTITEDGQLIPAPVPQSEISDPQISDPQAEAALATGPKSMMDVAQRAGKVDSPRLQFSKLKDVWNKVPIVAPLKKLFFGTSNTTASLSASARDSLTTLPPTVTTRDGRTVAIRHNAQGTEQTLFTHLVTKDDAGTTKPDTNKAAWVPRIAQTLQESRVRIDQTRPDGQPGASIYIARYNDAGKMDAHFVVVDRNGVVIDHGPVDALKTHWTYKEFRPGSPRAKPGDMFGKYADSEVIQFSQRKNGEAPAASDSGVSTGTKRNVSEQSRPTPGYTVWVDPQSGVSQSQGEALAHQLLAPREQLKPATTSLRDVTKDTAKIAREGARILNSALPGLVHDKVNFHANPEALLASGYAGKDTFTPEELADMHNAEGFFDNRTGHTVIFTDHIDVREGESVRAAVARVILHERVGHDGMNHLLQGDPDFAKAWTDHVTKIPEAELNAIAADYPKLAGDKNQLALEWFARQVERVASAQNARSIEGGLKGLARQMWDSLKALYARLFKGFAESLQTEHDLRQLITKASDAARNGTSVPTTAEGLRLQFSLGGTRVLHDPREPFRVNDLATRTILTGSSLPRAFHEAVQSTERERRACDQTAAQIGRDLNTAIESHAERTGTPLAQVYDMVHQAMSGAPGTNAVLLQVDPVLAERARVARNFIDDLSVAVAQTLPRGPLRNNIILNQGAWMRRSYAAFDPNSNWNFDNVMQAARAGEQLGGRPARDIVRHAAALLSRQNQYPAGMRDTHGLPRAGSVLEADMRDLMDRDTWANALTGSATVRKNVSSLITRQDIPAELRTLMGEDTNPIKRFANSTAFQVQFIQRHQQQQTLRTIGLGAGLFVNQRAGVNTTQIPDNHRWSPLTGLWTTPQLWESLQRVDGTERGNDFLAKIGEAVKWLGSEAKLNRVAMNPDSWLVNAAGNVVALCQTGDLFSTTIFSRIGQAIALMRAGQAKSGDVVNATTEAITDANRAMIARLNASGVLGETFSARDLEASLPRHILQWIDQDASGLRDRSIGALKGALYGQAAGRGLGLTGRAVGAVVGAAAGATAGHQRILGWQQTLANYVMTGPDALGRLTGFLGNLETAHAAGLTGAAAFRHAAERTRNTFPDYSKLPAILRSLSKYGLAGSFIAFQYEVYRNTAWNLRYAAQDLRSSNTALATRGAKRLVGASMIGYLAAGGLQALFQNAAGTDDERNNRWRRWFAAPWERHAVLAFTDYTDKSVSYFNTSYLVPQTTIAELVKAAMDGKDPADAAGNVIGQVWEQFMGSSVHIQPIVQALMNVDRMGRPITFQDGIAGAAERLDFAAQTILEPGWAAKLERLEYALRGAERRGRTFSVQEEIERFLGIRKFTRTWPDMVKRRYDAFARDYTAIRSEANKAIGTNLPGAKQSAIQAANAKIADLAKDRAAYDSDLPSLGVPRTLIDTARNDSTVPKTFHPLEIDPATNNRVRSVKH